MPVSFPWRGLPSSPGEGSSEAAATADMLFSTLESLHFLGVGLGRGWLLSRNVLSGQAHADTVLLSIPLIQNKFTQFNSFC